MKLYLTNNNNNNAYSKWIPGGTKFDSWKSSQNIKTVVIAKNVKNDLPTNDISCNLSCKKNKFLPNPIRHYRKHYINVNSSTTGFSNQSYIGSLDKPGGTIISTTDCSNLYQSNNEYIIDLQNITCKKDCFIIKSANTIIDNDNYSVSNRELLWKKCKTFHQNLPNSSCILNDCSVNAIFNPSNSKYKVQGGITSSARTAAIRYCAQDLKSKRCYITDYNRFGYNAHNKFSPTNDNYTSGCPHPNMLCKKKLNTNIFM